MSYLLLADYAKQIQADNLNQITSSNPAVRLAAEKVATEEIVSRLIQKYLIQAELTDILTYDPAVAYQAGNRVVLNPAAFDATKNYLTGNIVAQNGNVYRSTAGSAAHAFNVAEWTLIDIVGAMYYAKYPFPVYAWNGSYSIGSQVFYNGSTYKALKGTGLVTPNAVLQSNQMQKGSSFNVAPDDPYNGTAYWQNLGAYAIPAGSLSNTNYFLAGDTRSGKIVQIMIDLVLYELHSRIAPRNIPELRVMRYKDAICWLEDASQGVTVTAPIPRVPPYSGSRIRAGSRAKQVTNY